MNNNILTVAFGPSRTGQTRKAYQYDYGMVLKFPELSLPAAYEVHFANKETGVDSVTQIGGTNGVSVPDAMFISGDPIYVWIYLHTGQDDGETVYRALVPVVKRARPSDTTPDPVEQSEIDQAIAALNAAVEQTGECADNAEASSSAAFASEQAAAGSATNAHNSEVAAASSAASALASKTSAGQSALNASASEANAAQSADEAEQSAERAEQAADAAGASVTAVADSAGVASTKATEAAASASSALASAGEATTKAEDASASAATASTAAGEAAQSATNAAGSATAASGSASNANAAKLAAQAAQTASEAAQDAAISAKNDAVQAKNDTIAVKDSAVGDIQSAGSAQVGLINAAGSNQVEAVDAKGQEVIASIPADYTWVVNAINDHTSQIYSIGTELIGEIQTANTRYYDLWQAPKQGSVLTFKNVGTINGILGAIKQNGTFQNLIAFTSNVKEGTYTFDEQFKSIGFYGYQTGTVKIAVTGANFDMINENIIKNVNEETLPKFSELSGDNYDLSVIKSANIEEANTRLYNLWLPPAPGTYVVENLGLNFIFGGIKSNGRVVDLAVFNASNPRTQTVTITETLKSIGVRTYATGNVNLKISGKALSRLDKLAGKKVMFFGDSITADENRYRKWLLQNTGMELVESFAVSGATLTNYDDTVMDGIPTYGNHSNTVPNQVQKLINGTYSTVPDIVIVSAGTNDYYGKFSGGLNEAQFAVPDGTISSLAVYIDVDTCDLTTPSGAMRWIYEKIISVYPNTQVFFATPIQRATYPSLFTYLKTKHDTMCAIAERLSCCVIDATYKSGIYSRYENNGASGKYLADGLHPNEAGGKLLAKCYEDEIRGQIHIVET